MKKVCARWVARPRYYLGITTDRNYQLSELPLINVGNSNAGNSNVGNSEVFDRNFHFLIVSYRNYHCFLAAHRHLLVASVVRAHLTIRALYCDTHYIATSPNPNTITYTLKKCCCNIVLSKYSARTLPTMAMESLSTIIIYI